jgi:IstB-like ATP binding protein
MTSPSTNTMTNATGPVDPIGADLAQVLRALKLSGLKDTLPERLSLARTRKMGHAAFLELLLSDEVTRRDSRSAMLRARTAGLDPTMVLDTWTPGHLDTWTPGHLDRARGPALRPHAAVRPDQPGVHRRPPRSPDSGTRWGRKAHLAHALGHTAIRRRMSVHASRADKLFTRLRAARLDNTLQAEMRRLARVDLLVLDDFALMPLDATETSDFYELVVERHRKASTIVTSNREPAKWLTMMSDALLAQSAVDRLTAGAHTLIIEGPSYRQRNRPSQRAGIDSKGEAHDAH